MFVQPKLLRGRKPLIQFRAGKMKKEGNLVSPDPRKGVLTLVPDASGMMELIWTSLSDNTEESTMIFRGDATFNRVAKCTTGRVFVLDFGSRQVFWWLQEPSTERDEEYLNTVKTQIGDAKSSGMQGNANRHAADETPVTSTPVPDISMEYLQNILSGLHRPPMSQHPLQQTPVNMNREIDLQALLNSQDVLASMREDPAFYMTRLHEHLPEGTDPSSDVVPHIRNPQVSAAADLLQAALRQPDGFREITSAFGVPQGDGAAVNGIGAAPFLERIEQEMHKAEEKKGEDERKKAEKEDSK